MMRCLALCLAWSMIATGASLAAGEDRYGREAVERALADVNVIRSEFSGFSPDDQELQQLDAWKSEVTAQRKFSLDCISEKTENLDRVTADLTTLGEAKEAEDALVAEARKRLSDEQNALDQSIASCRLLQVDSEKLLSDLDRTLTELKRRQMLHRYLGVLAVQRASPEDLMGMQTLVRDFGGELGYPRLDEQWRMVFWVVLVLALALIPLVTLWLRRHEGAQPGPDEFARSMTFSLIQSSRRYGGMLATLVVIAAFWLLISWLDGSLYSEVGMSLSVLAYLVLLMAGRTFLAPLPPAGHFLPFDEGASRQFWRAVRFLGAVWASAAFLFYATFIDWQLLVALQVRFVYTALFAAALGWVVWVFFGLKPRPGFGIIRVLVIMTLMGAVVAEFQGYRNLSAFLIQSMTFTIMTLAVAWLVSRLGGDILDSLEEGRYPWQRRVHRWLGIAEGTYLPGVFWMRVLLALGVWLAVIWSLVRVWNIPESVRTQVGGYITEGFKVGEVTIVPTRILIALGVLAVLFSAISWLRKQLDDRWLRKARADVGARNAVSTLSAYVGAAIAILLALAIAGVDLSNLAIIAGALSVGIGFGLQNIVNNFVSGLILLFERPIKQGDWVVVGTTEGYVKRISVRSTQIQTFDNADVMVPNSELISTQVTNWMLRDRKGRVRVPVGVAYGSDVDKVRELLLGIALTHPQTVVDGSNPRPRALFMGFGPSSLDFELRFFIRNVDDRLNTISDVNFAIDKAFREAGITIPFPQTDVHLHYRLLPGASDSAPSESERAADELGDETGEGVQGAEGGAQGNGDNP